MERESKSRNKFITFDAASSAGTKRGQFGVYLQRPTAATCTHDRFTIDGTVETVRADLVVPSPSWPRAPAPQVRARQILLSTSQGAIELKE